MDVKALLGYNKLTAEGAGMGRNDTWYVAWHGNNMTQSVNMQVWKRLAGVLGWKVTL